MKAIQSYTCDYFAHEVKDRLNCDFSRLCCRAEFLSNFVMQSLTLTLIKLCLFQKHLTPQLMESIDHVWTGHSRTNTSFFGGTDIMIGL